MNYYDLVLVSIPVTLLGIAGTLMVAGVDRFVAVPLAASVAIGVISHAVFVNGPEGIDGGTGPEGSRPKNTNANSSHARAD